MLIADRPLPIPDFGGSEASTSPECVLDCRREVTVAVIIESGKGRCDDRLREGKLLLLHRLDGALETRWRKAAGTGQ
jgi:hypothetical protein